MCLSINDLHKEDISIPFEGVTDNFGKVVQDSKDLLTRFEEMISQFIEQTHVYFSRKNLRRVRFYLLQ